MFVAFLLTLLCLPAFAANDCPTVKSLTANDVLTGETVTISWSYAGGAPHAQTLSGHDFAAPVTIPAGQTSYSYTASLPGEKHASLTAVTACGTVSAEVKYHVKECNVVAPIVALDKTSVKPGDAINASIQLLPGHTARWVVTNGTASATTGSAIQVTAGTPGVVTIDVYVKRGNSCEVLTRATVEVVAPCSIEEPTIFAPPQVAANEIYVIFVPVIPAGSTITFEARGAERLNGDAQSILFMTPPSGSFEIDVIVSNGTCSRRFTRSYTITPCSPTATVSAGPGGSCDNLSIVADFTGTAPFQGYWSDGQSFFTFEPHLVRQVTAGGTYSITFFRDRFCAGTFSGSATVGASLPTPTFTVDPVPFGLYMGTDTCAGMPRTATLDAPIPAGAQIVWTVTNGTIFSGQGTATLQFAGTQENTNATVTAVFRNAEGCLSATHTVTLLTQGAPAGTVSVSPATIKAGETAIVTTTTNRYVRGLSLTSSLGDTINFLGQDLDGTVHWEYRSSHGGGLATITLATQSACGMSATTSTALTIENVAVAARATVRAIGSSCHDYNAYAEFTGVAPFSGTWSDGTSFTTDYPNAMLRPAGSGTYTLVSFSDANGPGTITGDATFNFTTVPAPDFNYDMATACPGTIVTAKLTNALPEGTTAEWWVTGGELLSGQGTDTITIRAGEFYVNAGVQLSGTSCSVDQTMKYLPVQSQPAQAPQFDLFGVEAGGFTAFYVYLDPNTETWGFENSLGDPMEIIENPQPNFYLVRYTSTHGMGTSDVRVYGTTKCGQTFEATRQMSIVAPRPFATLTSTPGESCGATITVTFTGTAPFTATWGDTGETFTTNSNTATRVVGQSGYYYLSAIADANRADGYGFGIYVETTALPYASWQQQGPACAGKTVKFSAVDVPAGYTMQWRVDDESANASIVAGLGTNEITVSTPQAGRFYITGWYTTAEGCRGYGWGYAVDVQGTPAAPTIGLTATSVAVGESVDFTIEFPSTGFQSLNWTASNGDLLFLGQNGYTFSMRYIAQTAGTATIHASGTTLCGDEIEATATLEVEP